MPSSPDDAGAKVNAQLVGAEFVPLLQGHLSTLHRHRDHPNRTLHFDTLLATLLLGFYESSDRSLRMFEDLSQSRRARMFLPAAVARTPRSTLSDALSSFDPNELEPVVRSLIRQLPGLGRVDDDLHALHKRILAADGSVFTVPADVAWATCAPASGPASMSSTACRGSPAES